jgi:hypothetical protein
MTKAMKEKNLMLLLIERIVHALRELVEESRRLDRASEQPHEMIGPGTVTHTPRGYQLLGEGECFDEGAQNVAGRGADL